MWDNEIVIERELLELNERIDYLAQQNANQALNFIDSNYDANVLQKQAQTMRSILYEMGLSTDDIRLFLDI